MPVHADQLVIVKYPDPILRRPAKPVKCVDDKVRAVASRMIELMHEAKGVGLAGPQVGLDWRIFVANPTGEPQNDRVFINPVLSRPSRETHTREEGCLSLPGVNAQIVRQLTITVSALDEKGRPFELTEAGFPARIWQHETDHLDGVLILDRMSTFDKAASRGALRELESKAGG